MNENFGVKGGYQDRRRTIKIKKELLCKLEEQDEKEKIKELEKKVRKQQITTFIKIVPFVLAGKSLSTVTKNEKKEQEQIITKNDKETNIHIKPVSQEISKKEQKTNKDNSLVIEEIRKVKSIPKKEQEEIITRYEKQKEIIPNEIEKLNEKQTLEEQLIKEYKDFPYSDTFKEKLGEIANKKLLDEYNKLLKSVKKDLKKLIIDYNVVVEKSDKLYTKEEAIKLLDKLDEIIEKIEELKSKYKVDDIDKYDQNYLYTIIEDYIKEFKNNKFKKEIENSPIYLIITKKLEELDNKKDKLEEKLEKRKEKLGIDEDKLKEIREKYYELDSFNSKLYLFQNEQDKLLRDLKERVANSVSIEEKVEIQLKAMDESTKKTMRMIRNTMLLPVPLAVKRTLLTTAIFNRYMRLMLYPEFETKKYKVIKVDDYSRQIKDSLNSLEDVEKMLYKSTESMDKLIKRFKKEYGEYFGKVKECDDLLYKLNKIKDEMNNKKEEIKEIKEEQKKNLRKNNEKVLTLNNQKYAA